MSMELKHVRFLYSVTTQGLEGKINELMMDQRWRLVSVYRTTGGENVAWLEFSPH